MNQTTISIIIAAAAFITSLFAANWLNQQHVEKLMEQFGQKYDAKLDAIQQTMNARFDAVNARFDAVNIRFDAINQRLDSIDQRVKRLEDVLFKPSLPGA